jgi:hypothetical protein
MIGNESDEKDDRYWWVPCLDFIYPFLRMVSFDATTKEEWSHAERICGPSD